MLFAEVPGGLIRKLHTCRSAALFDCKGLQFSLLLTSPDPVSKYSSGQAWLGILGIKSRMDRILVNEGERCHRKYVIWGHLKPIRGTKHSNNREPVMFSPRTDLPLPRGMHDVYLLAELRSGRERQLAAAAL